MAILPRQSRLATKPLLEAASLLPRQSNGGGGGGSTCSGTCLNGGSLAGIIIGTILGTILLMWVISSCTGGFGFGRPAAPAPPPPPQASYYGDIEGKRHRRHSSRHHSRRRSSIGVAEPTPVVVAERSRSGGRRPVYVYEDRARGRR